MKYLPTDLELLRRGAFGRCRAAGASVEDAQDCAQEAIASLLAHPDVEHPRAWVATVAYHRYIDLCRLRGREDSAGLMPSAAGIVPDSDGPEEEVVGRAHARWLVGAMRGLPASTRSVCSAVGTGMARQEVADRLGLTDRAVESHLTRARRSLRGLSLLAIAAVVALGRLLGRLVPASKPAAAAMIVPPFAIVVAIATGGRWGGGAPPDHPPTGAATPAAVQPVPDRMPLGEDPVPPAGPVRSRGGPAAPAARDAAPDPAPGLRPDLPLVPTLLDVSVAEPLPTVPVLPIELPTALSMVPPLPVFPSVSATLTAEVPALPPTPPPPAQPAE